MRIKSAIVVVLISVALLILHLSRGNPNFSGNWQLDYGRSEGGPAGTATFYFVQHAEPNIKVVRSIDTTKDEWIFTTDGKEALHMLACCGESKVRAVWKNGALLREVRWNGGVQRDRWTLSADGSVMTIVRSIQTGSQPETQLKLVFQRLQTDK
jgi:hypothetical protein